MNCSDKKKVFIKPVTSILDINPPIINNCIRELTIAQISHCIHQNAILFEILPDGTNVKLDYFNFNQDNSVETSSVPKVEPKTETVKDVKVVDTVDEVKPETTKETTTHISNKEKRRQDREKRKAALEAAKKNEEALVEEVKTETEEISTNEDNKKETEVSNM